MLQIQTLRENQNEIVERLGLRDIDMKSTVEQIISKDDERKKILTQLETQRAESNTIAKEISQLFKEGKQKEAEEYKSRSSELKSSIKEFEQAVELIQKDLAELLYQVPNVPHKSVKIGESIDDNETIFEHGEAPSLYDRAIPHWELASKFDLIDFELGVKITGAGFPVYKGKGAKLQRALINFFLDQAEQEGYDEIQPPILINEASGIGTGQLPDKEGQMYYVDKDQLYLIPTAEVPITNLYRDIVLKETDFPIKNAGYTPCFRREAGSYGKDVRGLNRLHQFDKVEIVQIQHPEKSYETLEEMVEYVKGLLIKLELQFRIVKLCGKDLGFASALTYDMEVFSAAQNKWLEVSSISNFESFQANRLKLRYKSRDGKPQLVHTLNGSALALPRIVASILENNQSEKGIKIPESLVPYTGFEWIN